MKTVTRIETEERKRHVLVVDDEMINRLLLGHILQNEFEIHYAADGEQALAFVEKEYETLSIILLDLLMPKVDGFQVLEKLHNNKKFRRIPVIVLTSEKKAEIRSLQLGAVDFIPKPYDMPEVIIARIKRSIKLSEENTLLNAVKNDSLTGLFNKEFFYQYALDQDRFHPEQEMDVLVLNVNRFHIVNELYGHKTGDRLLWGIADSLRFYLQQNRGLACRCYSDTFYVYIAHRTDYETLFPMFLQEVEKRSGLSGISIRIGVYENCDKSLSLDQRIDRAARACSSCRKSYNSSIAMFDKEEIEKELFCVKNSFRYIISRNSISKAIPPYYPVQKLLSAGTTLNWEESIPVSLFPCLKKTASFKSLTTMSGTRPPDKLNNGKRNLISACLFLSMFQELICLTRILNPNCCQLYKRTVFPLGN